MFSKETEYALRALVYIQIQNNRERRPGIDEIAEEINAPRFFIAKILQRLVRMGFVISMKGRGGGFFFDPAKPEVTLKALIIATGGGKILTDCGFGFKNCGDANPCPLHENYAPIRQAIDKLASAETIQSLAKKHGNRLLNT